jgi:transposase
MLASANAAGVDRRAPLYLMMDNASIHRGAVVSHALRAVSRRLHVAYQPPYMPTVNPVELVNNHLKQRYDRCRLVFNQLQSAAVRCT